MNVLVSTIFWGKDYFNNVVDYSLASLLSEHNAPAIAAHHTVTFLILTEKDLIEAFKQTDLYKQSCCTVHYEFRALEEYGFSPTRIPSGYHSKKYQFLSVCQNIVIELSKKYDVHIFNYADFIWSDGSLSCIVKKFHDNDIFALLGFCVPVDEKTVKPKLLSLKKGNSIALDSYQAVGLALDHMHHEATLRNWNRDFISNFPSYLYWEVVQEGIIIRAFHQTLMATAPTKGSAIYNEGIKQGTLDGNFSSEISKVEKTMVASDSEEVFVFSMFKYFVSSESKQRNKEEILRTFVNAHVSMQHLANFQTPFVLKRQKEQRKELWKEVIEKSLNNVAFIRDYAHDVPLHRDADVENMAAWKNQKPLPFAPHFVVNRIMPQVAYALSRCKQNVQAFGRKVFS